MHLFSKGLKKKQAVLRQEALLCLGKPYRYGAGLAEAPGFFDCSSLTQYLFKKIAIELPRSSIEQAHIGKAVEVGEQGAGLRIGDLLFFHGKIGHYNFEFPQGIGHVAIYLGDDECIHATGKIGKVVMVPLKELLERGDLVVVKRSV